MAASTIPQIHFTLSGALKRALRQHRVPELCGPASRSELIEGVGHFMMVERPTEINKRIPGFLDGGA